MELMNVSLQVADNKYGSQLPNGSWNGMIGDLINKVTLRIRPGSHRAAAFGRQAVLIPSSLANFSKFQNKIPRQTKGVCAHVEYY